jgi:hypothetical protein
MLGALFFRFVHFVVAYVRQAKRKNLALDCNLSHRFGRVCRRNSARKGKDRLEAESSSAAERAAECKLMCGAMASEG